MVTGISSIIDNNQLPRDSRDKNRNGQLPIGSVDALADELVKEYSNPGYRKWYCKVIYDNGIERVLEWRRRAEEGDYPAKLFSKYAKEASTHRASRDSRA
ncbi:MAG: hypothetical protein ACI9T8_000270 [Candidatus Saccharimonadales bacterium]|jgi:hypothetical protein